MELEAILQIFIYVLKKGGQVLAFFYLTTMHLFNLGNHKISVIYTVW